MGVEHFITFLPIGMADYGETSGDRPGFDPLLGVDSDIEALGTFLAGMAGGDVHYEVRPPITGTQGQIVDQLKQLRRELEANPGQGLIALWAGHAAYTVSGGLRLACLDDTPDIVSSEGFKPADLAASLVETNREQVFVILDVCQAGEASGAMASAVSDIWSATLSQDERRGFAALFSAHSAAKAVDGGIVPVLTDMLRSGPSPAATEFFKRRNTGS